MKTDKPKHQNNNSKKSSQTQEYLKYSGLGFQMIAIILLSWWLGNSIDKWTQSSKPVFTVLTILVGVVVSLVVVIIGAYKSNERK